MNAEVKIISDTWFHECEVARNLLKAMHEVGEIQPAKPARISAGSLEINPAIKSEIRKTIP